MILFNFEVPGTMDGWRVVDDGVMGGLSEGHFEWNESGFAQFHGDVSLENNGGFSSVRNRFEPISIKGHTHVLLRVKGDGKRYQFRLKSDLSDQHSYIQYFETNGEWQEIKLSLKDFYPTFRGRKLRMPNFPAESIAEVAFLIGNKKAESFELNIDFIQLL
ncbi:MAG: CIA30 family protein [Saprospiraceae bacterium]|nr:CIA30 family protein [Saprospiraceae bacterium]